MQSYPHFFRIRQHLERPRIDDVAGEVHQQLEVLGIKNRVGLGESVAITVGSRGISKMREIVKAVVESLRQAGAEPLIIPAMGSHGGATAQGQRRVVESYGITEEYCGCPIRSSMETVVVCRAPEGFDVHFDRHAYEADHVLVINRVKPHTRFAGEIESGLMKMLLIGLGKHQGAIVYHRAIMDYNFGQIIRSVANKVLEECKILGGLAIVENAFDETALIEAVASEEFQQREKKLLLTARGWLPKLPFTNVDVLVVDEIGKDISGTGIDTNVVGRKDEEDGWQHPDVRRIVVRSLSEGTHGNATGIGLVDFVTQRVIDSIDLEATWVNCLTGGHVEVAKLPIYRATDRETLNSALTQIGLIEPSDARMLWIRNTKKLAELECSAPYLEEARSRDDLEILSDLHPLPFNEQGNLPDLEFS